MINTLIGQKTDQTQKFLENGNRIPVTKISIPDNLALQLKTLEKDKYQALQIGAGKKKKANRASLGHAKKQGADSSPLKIREVILGEGVSAEDIKPGNKIALDTVFKPGDIIQVTGISKGKGFAGVVKRHGFGGGPKTHGQSDRHRAPGSIGQGTTPGRVYKGKRMAGRMGADTVTVKNLIVVDVDPEEKVLYVSGLIPGYKSSWVVVSKIGEAKNFVPLLGDKKEDEALEAEVKADEKDEAVEVPSEEKKADAELKDAAGDQEAVETVEEKVNTLDGESSSTENTEKSTEASSEKIDEEDSSELATADVKDSGESKKEEKDAS